MKLEKWIPVSVLGIGVAIALAFSTGAHANSVKLGDFARLGDGSIWFMDSQRQAQLYCADKGGLPTARQLAQALNPNAISETKRDGGFIPIFKADGSGVDFYYEFTGYLQRAPGDDGRYWLWSSTSDSSSTGYYQYLGQDGWIGTYDGLHGASYRSAVRCLEQ